MNVTFYLGVASGLLASRTLTITRMPRAGENVWLGTYPVAPTYGPLDVGGATTVVTVSLPANQIYQAVLRDVLATGECPRFDPQLPYRGTPVSRAEGVGGFATPDPSHGGSVEFQFQQFGQQCEQQFVVEPQFVQFAEFAEFAEF